MNWTKQQLWERFQRHYRRFPGLGMALDISRVEFPEDYFATMAPRMTAALAAMRELEGGAIANPDENQQVGHYWLRNPALSPNDEIRAGIEETIAAVKAFAHDVHNEVLQGAQGSFKNVLLIGIGGSALGPQFVGHALGHPLMDRMSLYFLDNTDPDGMDRVFDRLGAELGRTLCVVISKSGRTKETRNGMLEAQAAYAQAGLHFGAHAVAITLRGSELDQYAGANDWLHCFPIWKWVGGRTSQTSAVGLLPAALQGLDVDGLLAGAKACDEVTRRSDTTDNPAAQLALMWHRLGEGRGDKAMVVLPYKDRLELFARYLQQLVMESLGKEKELDGRVVHQGLTVYGNKGSTDQHAFIQQLRDGLPNFFVLFVEVLRDRQSRSVEVEAGVTSGDYLAGYLLGTREALFAKDRQSITLTLDEVSPFTVGALIALCERAVGLYAQLIRVNAYHQPGVEAGKKAADHVIEVQGQVLALLQGHQQEACTPAQLAEQVGPRLKVPQPVSAETVFKVCEHLAANPGRGVRRTAEGAPSEVTYQAE